MCKFCGTPKYRKIYVAHYGPIPKDEFGRSYEVHHKDGNRFNNDPNNLTALSINDHLLIHESQGDWAACTRIASRLQLPVKLISEFSKRSNNERVANGTHHLLGGEIQRKATAKRIAEGTHNFQGGELQSRLNKQRVEDGSHNLLGGEIQKRATAKRVADGTHNFLDGSVSKANNAKRLANGTHNLLGPAQNLARIAAGTHNILTVHTCPNCGKQIKGPGYFTHKNRCVSQVTHTP